MCRVILDMLIQKCPTEFNETYSLVTAFQMAALNADRKSFWTSEKLPFVNQKDYMQKIYTIKIKVENAKCHIYKRVFPILCTETILDLYSFIAEPHLINVAF